MGREIKGWSGRWGFALAAFGVLALGVGGAQHTAVYDALPEGPSAMVATLYYSALSLPGVSDWTEVEKAGMLDVATLRYKDRLVDRAPAVSAEHTRAYLERLAGSALVWSYPDALRQACAQFAVADGVCEAHAGYVRRVGVIEEMLVQGQLSLDELELELIGERRPRFGGQGR